jgi:hypothetical protein
MRTARYHRTSSGKLINPAFFDLKLATVMAISVIDSHAEIMKIPLKRLRGFPPKLRISDVLRSLNDIGHQDAAPWTSFGDRFWHNHGMDVQECL